MVNFQTVKTYSIYKSNANILNHHDPEVIMRCERIYRQFYLVSRFLYSCCSKLDRHDYLVGFIGIKNGDELVTVSQYY